jgi:hypothetical protein
LRGTWRKRRFFLFYAINMLQWIMTPQPCVFFCYYLSAAMFVVMAIGGIVAGASAVFWVRLSVACLLPTFCIFVY